MKIYHTETQADYDALMVELEAEGCVFCWATGRKMTESKGWTDRKENTCVSVSNKRATRGAIIYFKVKYPDVTITKYKAKVDDKMRFTKENDYKLAERYSVDQGYLLGDLKSDISKLDDKPEKVEVKKFVAEFYEGCKDANLCFLIAQLESEDFQSDLGKWYRDCEGRHISGRANAQEVIAKMKLYGYEVEKEPLYYIPLPHLETSDGIQQVLSKRKGDKHYFASRPTETLQQRYTKEELERVPEIYKPFAKLIEEEEE